MAGENYGKRNGPLSRGISAALSVSDLSTNPLINEMTMSAQRVTHQIGMWQVGAVYATMSRFTPESSMMAL
jgi:hypothetical protein